MKEIPTFGYVIKLIFSIANGAEVELLPMDKFRSFFLFYVVLANEVEVELFVTARPAEISIVNQLG